MWHIVVFASLCLCEEHGRTSPPPFSRGRALYRQVAPGRKKRKTRGEDLFLERMDDLIPWQILADRICPIHPKAGGGRIPTRCPPCCDSTASGSSTT